MRGSARFVRTRFSSHNVSHTLNTQTLQNVLSESNAEQTNLMKQLCDIRRSETLANERVQELEGMLNSIVSAR